MTSGYPIAPGGGSGYRPDSRLTTDSTGTPTVEVTETTQERITRLTDTVRSAEAELAAAQEELATERRNERTRRMEDRLSNIRFQLDADFRTDNPDSQPERAVLPFGNDYGKWNPRDVDSHPFGKSWLAGGTAIICRRFDQNRTRPTRLVHTAGLVSGGSDGIGSVFMARHDQTGGKLGVYEIVGLVLYDTDGNVFRIVGDVPNVKFALSTYK